MEPHIAVTAATVAAMEEGADAPSELALFAAEVAAAGVAAMEEGADAPSEDALTIKALVEAGFAAMEEGADAPSEWWWRGNALEAIRTSRNGGGS